MSAIATKATSSGELLGERRWTQVLVAVVVLVLIYGSSFNVLPRGDSYLAVPTALSLTRDLDLDLSEFSDVPTVSDHYALVTHNDREVDYFPWATAVAAIPLVLAVDLVAITGITPSTEQLIREDRHWPIQIATAGLVSAFAAVALAALSLRMLSLSGLSIPAARSAFGRRVRRWPLASAALLIGLTTPLWSTTSRALWQQGPSVLLLSVALWLGIGRPGWRGALAIGVLSGLAVGVRPTNVIGATAILVVLLLRSGVRRSIQAGSGVLITGVLLMLANLRFLGSALLPYTSGDRVGLHDDLAEAALANLVSPARGLLLFCPQLLLLLGLASPRLRSRFSSGFGLLTVVGVVASLGYLLAAAAYGHQWWAGHSYGPRFLIEALPFLLPSAFVVSVAVFLGADDRPRTRWVAPALWCAALVFHWHGGWFHSAHCWNGGPPDVDVASERVWSVDAPQIVSGFVAAVEDGVPAALWAPCGTP